MLILGRRAHKFEKTGALIAFLAILLISLDPSAQRTDELHVRTSKFNKVIMYLILLISNVPASLYFALNKSLMYNRLLPHLLLMNLFTCLGFCMLAIIINPDPTNKVEMNSDPNHGLFGWMNGKESAKAILGLGFMGTFWGSSVGYLIMMKFFSPVVCMNALLYEPLIS